MQTRRKSHFGYTSLRLVIFLFAAIGSAVIAQQPVLYWVSPLADEAPLMPRIVLASEYPIDTTSIHWESPYCWEDSVQCIPTVMVIPQSVYANRPDSVWHFSARRGSIRMQHIDTLVFVVDTFYTLKPDRQYVVVIRDLPVVTTTGTVSIDTVFEFTTVKPLPRVIGSTVDNGEARCSDTIRVWFNVGLDSADVDSLVYLWIVTGYERDTLGLNRPILAPVDSVRWQRNSSDSSELNIWVPGGFLVGREYLLRLNIGWITGEENDIWHQSFWIRDYAVVEFDVATVDETDSLPGYSVFGWMQYQRKIEVDSTIVVIAPRWVGEWRFVRWKKLTDTVEYVWNDTVIVRGDCDQLGDTKVIAEFERACEDTITVSDPPEGPRHASVQVTGQWVRQIDSTRWVYARAPGNYVVIEAYPDSGYTFEQWYSNHPEIDSVSWSRVEFEIDTQQAESAQPCDVWNVRPGTKDSVCDALVFNVKVSIAVDEYYRKYRKGQNSIMRFSRQDQGLGDLCSLYNAVDFVDIYVDGSKIEPALQLCAAAYLIDETVVQGKTSVRIRVVVKDPALEIAYWEANDGKRGGEPYTSPPRAWGSEIDTIFRPVAPGCEVELRVRIRRKPVELVVDLEMQDTTEVRGKTLRWIGGAHPVDTNWKWVAVRLRGKHYAIQDWYKIVERQEVQCDTLWWNQQYGWCSCEAEYPWRLIWYYVGLWGDTVESKPLVKQKRRPYWWVPPDSLIGDDNDSLYAHPVDRQQQQQKQYEMGVPLDQNRRRIRHQFLQPEFYLEWVGFPERRYDTNGFEEIYYKIVRPEDYVAKKYDFNNLARMVDEIPGTLRLLPPEGLKDLHLYYTHLRFKFNRRVDVNSLSIRVPRGGFDYNLDYTTALRVEEVEPRKDYPHRLNKRAIYEFDLGYPDYGNGTRVGKGSIIDFYLYQYDNGIERNHITHSQEFFIYLSPVIQSTDGYTLDTSYRIYGRTEPPDMAAWGIRAKVLKNEDNCLFSDKPDVYVTVLSGALREKIPGRAFYSDVDTVYWQSLVWWKGVVEDWPKGVVRPIPEPRQIFAFSQLIDDLIPFFAITAFDAGSTVTWQFVNSLDRESIKLLRKLIGSDGEGREELNETLIELLELMWSDVMKVAFCDDRIIGRYPGHAAPSNWWWLNLGGIEAEQMSRKVEWHFYEGKRKFSNSDLNPFYPPMNFFYLRSDEFVIGIVYVVGDIFY